MAAVGDEFQAGGELLLAIGWAMAALFVVTAVLTRSIGTASGTGRR